MAERIRPAPNGAKRAKSRLIQHVQDREIWVDCFSAFDMHNRCQQAVRHCLLDIIDVAADANAALRLPLNTEKERDHGEDSTLRRHQFKGWRQRCAVADVLRRCFAIRSNRPISRGGKHREQPSSESPLTRHRKIQLALTLTFEKRPGCIRAAASEKTK